MVSVRDCPTREKVEPRSPQGLPHAPMILLPVVTEPFSRAAIVIMGPLPSSQAGNWYVLTICDYGTRYPEAVPLPTVDDPTIAEELLKIFARVGIPRGILMDQRVTYKHKY